MKSLVLSSIRFYQNYLHVFVPKGTCRFEPVCSNYAYEAVSKYGTMTGIKLAVVRIARCHPWRQGGIDEVP